MSNCQCLVSNGIAGTVSFIAGTVSGIAGTVSGIAGTVSGIAGTGFNKIAIQGKTPRWQVYK